MTDLSRYEDEWGALVFPRCPNCGSEMPVFDEGILGSASERRAFLAEVEDALRMPLPNMACNILGGGSRCGRCGHERSS